MRHESLNFYVERLQRKPFSLIRFGDGELYCAWGRGSQNSNGCKYTPELRERLNYILQTPKDGVIYGLQRVLPGDQKRAEEYMIEWFDSEVFGDELVAGRLYPLIKQLREMDVVFIANERLRLNPAIPYNHFIEVPPNNAYEERERVYEAVRSYNWNRKGVVYVMCAGLAATVFGYELHDGKNFYLDLGHIFDPFVGNMSRGNLLGMTKEQVWKNLEA